MWLLESKDEFEGQGPNLLSWTSELTGNREAPMASSRQDVSLCEDSIRRSVLPSTIACEVCN